MTAYAIIRANVKNDGKVKEYMPLASVAVEKFGGKYIARGGKYISKEGASYERNVIVKFASLEVAEAMYESIEYKKARNALGDGMDRLFVIVEGLE